MTQEKIAIIAVTQDTAMFSEEDMKRINTELRTRFAEETDFKLKDENTIDEIIKEYKRSAKLCSNEECQIQIGKSLEWSVCYLLTLMIPRKKYLSLIFEKHCGK